VPKDLTLFTATTIPEEELAKLQVPGPPGPPGERGEKGESGLTAAEVAKLIEAALKDRPGGGPGGGAELKGRWTGNMDGAGFRLEGVRDARYKVHQATLQDPEGAYTQLAVANALTVDSEWSGRIIEFWGDFDGTLALAPSLRQDVSFHVEGDPGNRSITIQPGAKGRLNDLPAGTPMVLPGGRMWIVRVRSNVAGDNPQVSVFAVPKPDEFVFRFAESPGGPGGAAHVGRIVDVSAPGPVAYVLPAGVPVGASVTVFKAGAGDVTVQAAANDRFETPEGASLTITRQWDSLSFIKRRAGVWRSWS
jgi:hypothetical protein